MKVWVWGVGCLFLFGGALMAQFTPEEIAERPMWEEFLRTAEIVDAEQIVGRQAVTSPWKLTLEKDGVRRYALWKNPQGILRGYRENWKWEIAAYRLDKYLGLNMVPPTVERRFRGDRGSLQLWVDHWMSVREKNQKKIRVPPRKVLYYNRGFYLHYAFDNLIANEDRHAGNILITEDWRLLLIDHSRSFRTRKKFTEKLIYSAKSKPGPKIMKQLPRTFYERLKTLNAEVLREVVGEYLTDKEIQAVLKRRDLIVQAVEQRIAELGEIRVLY